VERRTGHAPAGAQVEQQRITKLQFEARSGGPFSFGGNMTEFTETLRHYCRNPRCRSKLQSPVTNPRDAFCTKGCHSSFYLHRCLVCERPIERKRDDQRVCRRAKCRNAWRAGSGFGRYATSNAKLASKTPDIIGVKEPLKPDRAWRIVAGQLSPSALHCATVGGQEAVEAINRTNARHWREANAEAEQRCSIKRDDQPVNIAGGYKFPGTPVIELAPITRSLLAPANDTAVSHDGSLDIPEFLRRAPVNPPLRLAA
jgi:hypothetical protein